MKNPKNLSTLLVLLAVISLIALGIALPASAPREASNSE